jgi:hypothetical protein
MRDSARGETSPGHLGVKMINTKLIAGVALALGLSSNANAAITVFTDQASFLAAISAPATDTFQDLSIVGLTPTPLTRAVGAYGYSAAASGGFYGAGTPADHWLSTNTATDAITLGNFTGGVFGLGGTFFGSNMGGSFVSGSVILTATDADGSVSKSILNATTSSFLGFVSTSGLTGVTLAAVQPSGSTYLWPTADNLTLGGQVLSAVPEPATWAMMIIGFGAVGSMVRTSRRRNAFSAV